MAMFASDGPRNSADRAAPTWRSVSCRNMRSSVPAYPAPYSVSSYVSPKTCGTPNRSRTIVTPARGEYVLTMSAGATPSAALL
jgi:hypothetical protein